jgi:hypothetical protein
LSNGRVFQNNFIPGQPARHGVMADRDRRTLAAARAHPIDNHRHAFPQPGADHPEISVVDNAGCEAKPSRGSDEISAGRAADAAGTVDPRQFVFGNVDPKILGDNLERVLFAREGADVAIVYLDEDEDAAATKRAVEAEGRRCITLAGNVANSEFCRGVIKKPPRNSARSIS